MNQRQNSAAWQKQLSQQHCKYLSDLNLHQEATVMEVGPGAGTSVALALASINFQGCLLVLDAQSQALQQTVDTYRRLLPNAKVFAIGATLREFLHSKEYQAKAMRVFDVIIGNHVLDDFLIGKSFATGHEFQTHFDDHYSDCSARTAAIAWQKLLNTPDLLQQAIEETVEEWEELAKLSSKGLVLSAYDSLFYRRYSKVYPVLSQPDVLARQVLQQLQVRCAQEFSAISVDNDWLCLQRAGHYVT